LEIACTATHKQEESKWVALSTKSRKKNVASNKVKTNRLQKPEFGASLTEPVGPLASIGRDMVKKGVSPYLIGADLREFAVDLPAWQTMMERRDNEQEDK
jgi:hypothetical protein